MSEENILQATQFKILELGIITEFGSYDISGVMEELNIFDNVFSPCMSGNIIVKDALNIFSKLKLDGNEYINISINKDAENASSIFNFRKQFRVYKVSNIKNSNLSSKTYVLHFASEEFILAQQLKLNQSYSGTYSEIVKNVMTDSLLIDENYSYVKYRNSLSNYKQGTLYIHPTSKYVNIVAPNINPIKFIDLLCKRAVIANRADMVFYENQFGYNFDSISRMMTMPSQFINDFNQEIPFRVIPKNTNQDVVSEMFGIRDLKIINNINVPEMIKSGTFVGKFVGFDTLTRKVNTEVISPEEDSPIQNKNKKVDLNSVNELGKTPVQMEDSRVVTYPFMTPRLDESWIVENNKRVSDYADNTEEYVFQRAAYLKQITQQRLKLTMAGNFGLYSGSNILVEVPKFSIKDDSSDGLDESLNGKYLIVATRHIIRYDKHETVVEVITDSYGGAKI